MTKAVGQPFGTILGYGPGNVAAYSSDYETVLESEYPSRKSFRSYYDGIYMGYKWQCVEYARRWLYINFGYIFDDVAMAYDIFDLRSVRDTKTNALLPFNAFTNGSKKKPEFGCLLIWQEGGEFEDTGHVAVVTEVTDSYIRIAEQNVGHASWSNRDYARELAAKVSESGEYWITCSYGDAQILGWMIQTDDTQYAEPVPEEAPELKVIQTRHASSPDSSKKHWLNIANIDEEAFVAMMGGHFLAADPNEQTRYFLISRSAFEQLENATNELHGMFMHATDYVLEHEHLLQKFNLPEAILPKIKQSWGKRLNQIITSRFDFALTPKGLKVYEYNCDSASCYMEAGKIQGKWAQHYQVKIGSDAGRHLFKDLVKTWKKSQAQGLVHLLRDNDPEEKYHAYFMKDAIEAAGLDCKVIDDLSGLSWGEQNQIQDADGTEIRWVWKTWAWETALDQIREKAEASESSPDVYESSFNSGGRIQLSDVLFHKDIMVFEPLWSLIPSNKAILPVLWSLFPNHPLLLNSSFELTPELQQTGYVKKPIVGRCGSNITLVNDKRIALSSTGGSFDTHALVYQELFPLPKVEQYYVQLCTFTAAGIYSGSGVRVDKDMIINKDSDCMPLRIVDDKLFLTN